MEESSLPVLLECETLRLCGHAAYDKGQYVPADLMDRWRKDDPLLQTRSRLADVCGLAEPAIAGIEEAIETEVREAVARALAIDRPRPPQRWPVHAETTRKSTPRRTPWRRRSSRVPLPPAIAAADAQAVPGEGVKNGDAVNLALDYLLANRPGAFLAGMDVGVYGSAFKTCKGLIERYGTEP